LKDDFHRFQEELARDAVVCSEILYGQANDDLKNSLQFVIHCIGVDHLISRDVLGKYKDVKAERRRHVKALIDEQVWQRSCNIDSPKSLARVAKASSHHCRVRAQDMAKIFASIYIANEN
jgi:hypothetical protein